MQEITNASEDVANREPWCTVGENILGIATVETNIEIPQKKLRIELVCDAVISFLHRYLKT